MNAILRRAKSVLCAASAGFISLSVSTIVSATDDNEPLYIKSGEHRVELVELYTSEGCSSCPPADAWISKFKKNDGLWNRVVPVAFHVDYWDYIGWPDKFASPKYGDRQRDHAARLGMRTVYTPGIFLSGNEWRRWRNGTKHLQREKSSGVLEAAINPQTGEIAARYVNRESETANFTLHTAVLGFDITTEVERGENRGRILTHDFVVLGYRTDKMTTGKKPSDQSAAMKTILDKSETVNESGNNNSFIAQTTLPTPQAQAQTHGIAMWISQGKTGEPLQATGAWLPGLATDG